MDRRQTDSNFTGTIRTSRTKLLSQDSAQLTQWTLDPSFPGSCRGNDNLFPGASLYVAAHPGPAWGLYPHSTAALHEQGIRAVIILDPGVKKELGAGYRIADSIVSGGHSVRRLDAEPFTDAWRWDEAQGTLELRFAYGAPCFDRNL